MPLATRNLIESPATDRAPASGAADDWMDPSWRDNEPGAWDAVSEELGRKWTLITIAAVIGLGVGFFGLRAAGDTGSVAWLSLALVAITSFALLLRKFEIGIVAFLCVCWIAIGTPAVAQGSGGGQRLLISQAGLLLLLTLWIARLFYTQKFTIYRTPINVPIALYLAVCVWSTVNGILFPDPDVLASNAAKQFIQVNILEILTRVLALGGLLMIANTLRGRELKAGALALLLPGLLAFTGVIYFIPSSLYLAFPEILTMAVLASFALSNGEKLWLRIACGIVAASIFGVFFFKGAEWVSGWAGALVALSLITYQTRRKIFWATVAFVGIAIVIGFPYFYQKIYKDNFYGSGPTNDITRQGQMGTFENDRTRMLRASFRYAYEFPVGIGLGNYRSYNQYFGRVDVWNTTAFTSAHGTFAQALSETGWPGLLTLLLFLFSSGRFLSQTFRALPPGRSKTYVLGAWGGVIGVYAASFNGDYLFPSYHNGGMGSFGATVYIHLIVGMCIAIAREKGLDWGTLIGEKKPVVYVEAKPIYNRPNLSLPAHITIERRKDEG